MRAIRDARHEPRQCPVQADSPSAWYGPVSIGRPIALKVQGDCSFEPGEESENGDTASAVFWASKRIPHSLCPRWPRVMKVIAPG